MQRKIFPPNIKLGPSYCDKQFICTIDLIARNSHATVCMLPQLCHVSNQHRWMAAISVDTKREKKKQISVRCVEMRIKQFVNYVKPFFSGTKSINFRFCQIIFHARSRPWNCGTVAAHRRRAQTDAGDMSRRRFRNVSGDRRGHGPRWERRRSKRRVRHLNFFMWLCAFLSTDFHTNMNGPASQPIFMCTLINIGFRMQLEHTSWANERLMYEYVRHAVIRKWIHWQRSGNLVDQKKIEGKWQATTQNEFADFDWYATIVEMTNV